MGGGSSNDDEQERISRMNDDETSCIPQSLILNDKIKREERRRSSVRIGSGIHDGRSPLEIGRSHGFDAHNLGCRNRRAISQ